jgi:hypothetical protein
MKLSDFAVTFGSTDEEWYAAPRWDSLTTEQQGWETAEAWERWVIASCAERNSGHWWWLDWDEADGLHLSCQHCPAGVDELYPDGQDVLFGELPAAHGLVLRIDSGSVPLDTRVLSWSGPVLARVETEYHRGGPWGGPEQSAWVVVEAAP